MQVDSTRRLDADQVEAVLTLARDAAAHDQVRPLSEQTLLEVRGGPAGEERASTSYLLYDGSRLAGYAHRAAAEGAPGDAEGGASSAELVVAPDRRGHHRGRALLDAVLADDPRTRVWAHGDLAGARALGAAAGLVPVRELWQMRRPLTGEWCELPEVTLPPGFRTRSFEPGKDGPDGGDEAAWLRVNARAFASHAEQGRMTRADLEQRMAEPWFDPSGFILVEDVRQDRPALAAFHWTKVEPSGGGEASPTSGEVYVVGVDPAYQGVGLGRTVTVLGLAHLHGRGLEEATLYVDGDNEAALATYGRLGFERSAVDVMYAAPTPGRQVPAPTGESPAGREAVTE